MARCTLDFLLLVSLIVCMLCSQVASKRRQSRLGYGGFFQQDEAPPIVKEDLDAIMAVNPLISFLLILINLSLAVLYFFKNSIMLLVVKNVKYGYHT